MINEKMQDAINEQMNWEVRVGERVVEESGGKECFLRSLKMAWNTVYYRAVPTVYSLYSVTMETLP